ncbi:DUF2934 domain-containing protein [Candidatus Desantisbacteria bacterium]|nr:DUF2934 domain-containing protein [Candidatus Desantisbacteria bacterium]
MAKKTDLDLNSKVSKDHLSKTQLDKKISEVAYNLYEKRNYAHGNDLAD